jgi:DNA-binding winged helix-turn-helix (wHTH) protein
MRSERERLVARIEDIRSMLRDANSLDVIETLVLALADLEQRVAWIDGEVTPEPASPQPHAQAENSSLATPPDPIPGT